MTFDEGSAPLLGSGGGDSVKPEEQGRRVSRLVGHTVEVVRTRSRTKGEKQRARSGRKRRAPTINEKMQLIAPLRHPNGNVAYPRRETREQLFAPAKFQRAKQLREMAAEMAAKQAVEFAADAVFSEQDMLDPRLSYALGRMYVMNEMANKESKRPVYMVGITEGQHNAGLRYAKAASRARRALDAPSPQPRAPSDGSGRRPEVLFDFLDAEQQRQRVKKFTRWRKTWDDLRSRIIRDVQLDGIDSRDVLAVLEMVCVLGVEAKNDRSANYLRKGLWVAQDFFKIRY